MFKLKIIYFFVFFSAEVTEMEGNGPNVYFEQVYEPSCPIQRWQVWQPWPSWWWPGPPWPAYDRHDDTMIILMMTRTDMTIMLTTTTISPWPFHGRMKYHHKEAKRPRAWFSKSLVWFLFKKNVLNQIKSIYIYIITQELQKKPTIMLMPAPFKWWAQNTLRKDSGLWC